MAFGFHALDAGAAAVEVAHDIALELVWSHILDLHDRLEQDWFGFFQAVFEREDRSHFEGHFVRVDIVVGTVCDIHMHIDDRVAGDDSVEDSFLEALFDCGNVFLGNGAADNFVLDGEAFATLVRADLADDMAVLTAPAGLLDEFSLALGNIEDGLLVSDLWLARVCFDLELPQHAVANDFEVELTHASDDCLAGFLVCEHAEGRIFFSKTLKGDTHLFLVLLGLWLDGHRNHGIREGWGLEENRMILVAECVTSGDVFDAHNGGDVTRIAGVDILALVGLNLDESTDAFALVCAWVVDGVALRELAGVNAEENELSDERIAPKLECQRAKLGMVV